MSHEKAPYVPFGSHLTALPGQQPQAPTPAPAAAPDAAITRGDIADAISDPGSGPGWPRVREMLIFSLAEAADLRRQLADAQQQIASLTGKLAADDAQEVRAMKLMEENRKLREGVKEVRDKFLFADAPKWLRDQVRADLLALLEVPAPAVVPGTVVEIDTTAGKQFFARLDHPLRTAPNRATRAHAEADLLAWALGREPWPPYEPICVLKRSADG